MPEQQKIILVNDSRLLRSIQKFSTVIEHTAVDWIVLAQRPEEPIPIIINQVLRNQPDLNLMMVATDGSRVRTRWIETHDANLDEKNLQEILATLRQNRSSREPFTGKDI